MGNKITLVYEEGRLNICLNDTVIHTENDIDQATEYFKKVIKNNGKQQDNSWNEIKAIVENRECKDLEVNETYKTVTLGDMKYFHNTGNLVYMNEGKMILLIGGFRFVTFILERMDKEELKDYKKLLELCIKVIEEKATYRVQENAFIISSPVFDYGFVEYHFHNGQINKGSSSETGSFESFCEYAYSRL